MSRQVDTEMDHRKNSGYSRVDHLKRESITFLNQCLSIESKENINQGEHMISHLESKV